MPEASPCCATATRASWRWAWRLCCPTVASGTACAPCARTTPATTCATCSSAPRARWASSPPQCSSCTRARWRAPPPPSAPPPPAAGLKPPPRRGARAPAWVGARAIDALVGLLAQLRAACGERLVAFEMMSAESLGLILAHLTDVRPPLAGGQAFHPPNELDETHGAR